MKAARSSNRKQIRNVSPQPEPEEILQEEIQAWEPLDDELWVPFRVRGSWRGGVLG
jgi:hypothetical protein